MVKIELTSEEYTKLLHCVALSINHFENELKDCKRIKAKNQNSELDEVILDWENQIRDKRPLLDKLFKMRIKE